MATWIIHLRVAENILKKFKLEEIEFLAGNIGPDSGVPNESWTSFKPPKAITHWLGKDAQSGKYINGTKIDAEGFYQQYIEKKIELLEDKERSFLLGYYVHLLTDIEWSKMHRLKQENEIEYKERLEKDSNFISEVKQDWYGLDFSYIRKHKHNVFNTKYLNIGSVDDYIDYFPEGAFTLQMKYIQNFYQTKEEDYKPTGRYLTMKEMNMFVKQSSEVISDKLSNRLPGYCLKGKGENDL